LHDFLSGAKFAVELSRCPARLPHGIDTQFQEIINLTSRTSLAAVLVVGSLAGLASQALPPAPTNLRIVTGKTPKPTPIPQCVVGPATGKPAHAYFEALVRRAEHFCSWSLRDQAQVNALTSDGDATTTWTYDPRNDKYSDPQDALKYTRINPPVGETGHGKASVPQHDILRMNAPNWNLTPADTDSVLIIWDQYWGPEYRDNAGEVSTLKTVGIQNNAHTWWTVAQRPGPPLNTPDPTDVAVLGDNFANNGGDAGRAAGMLKNEPVLPSGPGTPKQQPERDAAPIYQGVWHRNILEIRLGQPASAFSEWNAAYNVTVLDNPTSKTWYMVSRWVLHEHQDGAQRVLYRVPMGHGDAPAILSGMRLTMDSSKDGFIGPWYGYFRNLVVLKNYKLPAVNPESDKLIFQRPVR
jgi:hypothetical protein